MDNGSNALLGSNSTMQAGVPFAVRKRAIDMSQIQTIGTDNLNTTFSGDTHSLLSALGVRVLNSEEVEKNLLEQANTLSERQSPEYKELSSLCTLTLPKTPLKILSRLNIEYQKQIQSCNSKHYYSTLVDDVTFLRYRQRFLVSYIDQLEKQQKQKYLSKIQSKSNQKRDSINEKQTIECPFKTRRITTPTENEPARIEEPVVVTPSYIRTEEPSEYDSSSIPPKNQSSSIPLSQENTSSMPPSEHKSSSSSPPPPPSPPQSSSESRCPICNILFDSTMSFRQRTRHVEKCLSSSSQSKPKPKPTKPKQSTNVNKTPSPSSSKSSTKKSVYEDDDLWEEEPGTQEEEEDSFEDLSSYCVREKGISSSSYSHQIHSSRDVLIDDSDSSLYSQLLYSYLQWRNPQNSQEERDSFYHLFEHLGSYQPTVSHSYTPSSIEIDNLLDQYYLHEPCLLLSTGHLIPTHIWDTLYPYQQKGVIWLLGLHIQQVGGILADEMGLGKTLQIIAALIALKFTQEAQRVGRNPFDETPADETPVQTNSNLNLNLSKLPSLLIVPATLLNHWLREFHHWCPLLRCVIIHSMSHSMIHGETLQSILLQCKRWHSYDIIISTYEGFRQSSLLCKQDWFYAILDEGGKIKNANVAVSRKCKQLQTVHRVLISGTPLQNNLKEFWSLVDFVYPGKLGTFEAFNSSIVIPIQRGIYSNATRQASSLGYQCSLMLHDSISPYILRRLKRDVKTELPPKTEQVLACSLSPIQEDRYIDYLQSEQVQASIINRITPFKAIVRLRQICNHPVFYKKTRHIGSTDYNPSNQMILHHSDDIFYTAEYSGVKEMNEEEDDEIDYEHVNWRDSSKMLVMNEVLQLWKKENHKVLVYTQTVSMLNIIQKYVEEQGFTYCRMDGSTPVVKRQNLVDMFNSRDDIFLFLLTTRVGGLGLNLVGADRVILFDPDWNPSVDIQARERCWRIGQKKPVTIYRLITSGTIEEKIYHRQIFKTVLSNRVFGEGNDLCSFTSTNMNDLFTYSKRERGTETGEIFPQGQILPEDVQQDKKENPTIEVTEESEDDIPEEVGDKVLACLFNHGELKSVFNHDYAFNNTDVVTISRMEREAREEARELERQLIESRQQYNEMNISYQPGRSMYSDGTEQQREAKISSAIILQKLKKQQRKRSLEEQPVQKEIPSSHIALANLILHYFRVRQNHSASTENILSYFKKQVRNEDKYLFRRLLRSFTTVKKNIWTLKNEWL